MKTSGEHSIVCVSKPSLSETNVTLYESEVDVRVVAVLGALGANPWTETARARERRVLANMLIDYFGGCLNFCLCCGLCLAVMISSSSKWKVVSSDFLVQPPRDSMVVSKFRKRRKVCREERSGGWLGGKKLRT
jgi:hypothetical protein